MNSVIIKVSNTGEMNNIAMFYFILLVQDT